MQKRTFTYEEGQIILTMLCDEAFVLGMDDECGSTTWAKRIESKLRRIVRANTDYKPRPKKSRKNLEE